MKTLTSVINVQVDAKEKEQVINILKDQGLNMSTAVKRIIKNDELPYEISDSKPSKELLEALEEGEQIIKEVREGKRQGYKNVNEMMSAILG